MYQEYIVADDGVQPQIKFLMNIVTFLQTEDLEIFTICETWSAFEKVTVTQNLVFLCVCM